MIYFSAHTIVSGHKYCTSVYLPFYIRRKKAYAVLISHLNYCLEVVTGTTAGKIKRIERMLHMIVRYVYGLHRFDHISEYIIQFQGSY